MKHLFSRLAAGSLMTLLLGINSSAVAGPQNPPAPHVEPLPSEDTTSTKVAAIPGQFQVGSGGDANYSVPIYAPKGVADVTPQLALNYSSQQGNGPLGLGWKIEGLSSITRCRQTKEQDGQDLGLNLSQTDRFCLDGKKLIAVGNGQYGADHTEYRTEIDSQSKIISYGTSGSGPLYFKVWRKDGSVSEYGQTEDARLYSNQTGTPSNTVMTWARNRFADNMDNVINFTYLTDNDRLEQVLDEVQYAPNNTIRFNYSGNRVDQVSRYRLGGKSELSKRLTSIQSFDSGQEVRKLSLGYTVKNKRYQLNKLTQSAFGVTLPQTKFSWSSQTAGYTQGAKRDLPNKYRGGQQADLNGDGKQDLIYIYESGSLRYLKTYLSNGSYYTQNCSNGIVFDADDDNEDEAWHPIDYNGDGRTDVILARAGNWHVYVANSVGCLGSQINTGISTHGLAEKALLLDINGDGLGDLVRKSGDNQLQVHYLQTTGSSSLPYQFSSHAVTLTLPFETEEYDPANRYIIHRYADLNNFQVGDFNGDGRADLVVKITERHETYDGFEDTPSSLSTRYDTIIYTLDEQQQPQQHAIVYSLNSNRKDLQVVDLNNDGLADLLYRDNYAWRFRLNTGTALLSPVKISGIPRARDIFIADENLDGFVDLHYVVSEDYLYVARGTGSGFLNGVNTGIISDISKEGYVNLFSDVNGDGLPDHVFLRAGKDDQRVSLHKGSFKASPRITQIDNGLGNKTKINYHALTDPGQPNLYTRGNGAGAFDYGKGSPVFDLLAPVYVVSSVSSNTPAYVGGNSYQSNYQLTSQYRYQGARIQAGGRGFLGFETRSTIDPRTGFISETRYLQNFPYIGMVASSITKDNHENLLKRTVNNYAHFNLNDDKVKSPYLQRSTVDNFAVNSDDSTAKATTVLTTNQYAKQGGEDNHVNLKKVTIETRNGSGQWQSRVITENDYQDSVDDWWLGRMTSSKVSYQRPGKSNIVRHTAFGYYPTGHNNAGMLEEEIIEPQGGVYKYLRTLHCYDHKGNTVATVSHSNHYSPTNCSTSQNTTGDPAKVYRRELTEYDNAGRYITSQSDDKFVQQAILARNQLGLPTKTRDTSGVTRDIAYDAFGRQYFSRNDTGLFHTISVRKSSTASQIGAPTINEPFYRVEKHHTAGAPLSFKYFDVSGQQVASVTQGFNGSWIKQYTRYDELGRVVKSSVPHYAGSNIAWHSNQYDDYGRVVQSTAADGTLNSFSYNALNTEQTTSSNYNGYSVNHSRIERKNALGETVSVTDNAGQTITYDHNAAGNHTTLTGIDGKKVITGFDNLGRKISLNDPDKGHWQYQYNALGERISQTSANGHTSRYYRDSSGRRVKRSVSGNGVSETTQYQFDNSNLLQSVDITSGPKTAYQYDNLGRVSKVTTTIEGKLYQQRTTYDAYGRTFQTFDASGDNRGLQMSYKNGYLHKKSEARDGRSGEVYYQVKAMNALSKVTQFKNSNGTVTTRSYDGKNGYPSAIVVTNSYGTLQDDDYNFDGLGNLRTRQRNSLKSSSSFASETFKYDGLNRLTHVNDSEKVRYYGNGNIKWKLDVNNGQSGYYCYGSAKPHAVTGIGNASNCSKNDYSYDANGNMLAGRNRTISYGHYNKPTRITMQNGDRTDFAYDASRNRYKRVDKVNGLTITTYRLADVEIITRSDSNRTQIRRTIENAMHAIWFENGNQVSDNTRYLHTDHLGSVATITNRKAKAVQKLYHDAWGKQQQINYRDWKIFPNKYLVACGGMSAPCLVDAFWITQKGFTGHEHVLHSDLIHMNGRIYDPSLGRFLQADTLIQSPTNGQNLNRYSYVLNNPLSFTDPSGLFFKGLGKFFKKFLRPLIAIAINIYLPGAGGFFDGGFWATVVSGGISGAVASGNLQGALTGAFSAGLFHGIGTEFGNGHGWFSTAHVAKSLAHGAAGGLTSVLNGGKFGHCFLSGAVSQLAAPGIDRIGGSRFSDRYYELTNRAKRIIVTATLAGSVSELTGGKFANGAVTGAFSRAFNDEAKHGGWKTARRMMRENLDVRKQEILKSSSWKVTYTAETDVPTPYGFITLSAGGAAYAKSQGIIGEDPSISGWMAKVNLRTGEVTYNPGLSTGMAQLAKIGVGMEFGFGGEFSVGAQGCLASHCLGVSNDLSFIEGFILGMESYIYRVMPGDFK